MASACIDEKDISKYLEHIHPNLLSDIESYKVAAHDIFPAYHGCRYRNRNGTGKEIEYNRGEICVLPIHTACWRKTKKKYLSPKVYHTRYRRKLYEKGLFLASLFNRQLLHPKYEYY